MVFPVVVYGCESWIIKKAEHESIDALHRGAGEEVQEDRQSVLKKINPEYSS